MIFDFVKLSLFLSEHPSSLSRRLKLAHRDVRQISVIMAYWRKSTKPNTRHQTISNFISNVERQLCIITAPGSLTIHISVTNDLLIICPRVTIRNSPNAGFIIL